MIQEYQMHYAKFMHQKYLLQAAEAVWDQRNPATDNSH